MNVDARYRGGEKKYPGTILTVNRDGTCDIGYDDGDKEFSVRPNLITPANRTSSTSPRRALRSNEDSRARQPSSPSRAGLAALEVGARVEAKYKGRARYYPGKIARVHRDGSFDIDYDDGEKERMVDRSLIRVLQATEGERRRSQHKRFEEGMRVEARYKGRSRYYAGTIARVHLDGSCDLHYDDGEKEQMVEPSLIKITDSGRSSIDRSSSREAGEESNSLREGMKIEARYKGRSRFYPGKIARVHRDGSCDIDYDDGEKERMVEPKLIEVIESRSSRGSKGESYPTRGNTDTTVGANADRLSEGAKVEARYNGRSRYYPGVVTRVRLDGSCDITYDDGEKEFMVDRSLVKILSPSSRSSSKSPRRESRAGASPSRGGQLREGAKVKARYKGRSRYYPGKITQIHRDGTCDVDYDDGEMERAVDPSLIEILADSDETGKSADSGDSFREGMKIEARYKGRSRYYPGRISRVHRNGTCDIDYDDGEKERMVDPSMLKALEGSRDGVRSAARQDNLLRERMRVEARYKGRSRYYPGEIAHVHRDGTCDVDYDDGEKESMVDPSLVKVIGNEGARDNHGVGGDLREGVRVEARYKGRSRYYPGKISKVYRDGSCDIDYDDGEKERMVEPRLINVLGGDKGTAPSDASGILMEGMIVEARYKSRSRYYPGKISRVHRDGSCDIDYDDGEKERMVDPSLIKALGPSKGTAGSNTGNDLREGARVEARYKGRSRYYPGKISRVHRDGSCDIDYDDGEKERMVDPSLVKALGSGKGTAGSNTGNDLREGARVEARYKGRSRYYPGKISRVHLDGSCDIDYDDGEKERMVDPSLVKALGHGKGAAGSNTGSDLREGMIVEARYKGRSRYYPGKISRVHRDGSCDIDYDDGEKERMVDPSLIKTPAGYNDKTEVASGNKLREGMNIEARYRGRSRYFPGKISRVHLDGTCDIDYDNGEKEHAVDSSLIKVLGRDTERAASEVSDNLREEMKVEARYKGRSRFYPGNISRVHRDGTCDIDYDDGENERMVEPSLIRAVGLRSSSPLRESSDRGRRLDHGGDAESGGMEEGMRVEARYKGRSRYYPGKVSRVHRDGSRDINYDDGEKELRVDSSLVRVLDSRRNGDQRTSPRSRVLREGQKVEARYKGRSRYYSGKIYRVHRDGSCDISYEDGEKEYMVDPSLIKTIPPDISSSDEAAGSADEKLQVGMRIKARYKGRSRYYPGKISRVRLDGSCDIDYDDGERERMVEPSLIRTFRSQSKTRGHSRGSSERGRRSARQDDDVFEEGMKIEARYKGRSRYYPGTVVRVHRDGSCDVDYDDGEQERMVDPSLIKKVAIERGAATSSRRSSGVESLLEGDAIDARHRGRSKYYPGRVARVHRDGTFDIVYDDGDKEMRVTPELVRAR
ncbi:unnamed protein product, partial [Sphacelaria rigidula]